MSVERDLLGWDLDDVLEGYDVDLTVETCEVHLDEIERVEREARNVLDCDAIEAGVYAILARRQHAESDA